MAPWLLLLAVSGATLAAHSFSRSDFTSSTYSYLNFTDASCQLPRVHLWGAGGGGGYFFGMGGGAAYVTGLLPLPAAAKLRIIVGRGGWACGTRGTDAQGCGGGANVGATLFNTGSGGGRSAVQLWSAAANAWVEVVSAGGGGGGYHWQDPAYTWMGGAGGLFYGFRGNVLRDNAPVIESVSVKEWRAGGGGPAGGGVCSSADHCGSQGASDGSQFCGGSVDGELTIGGGGGRFGGARGYDWMGAGGGSSRLDMLLEDASVTTCLCEPGLRNLTGGRNAAAYLAGVGLGGSGLPTLSCPALGGAGGHGLVIIDCAAPLPSVLVPVAEQCSLGCGFGTKPQWSYSSSVIAPHTIACVPCEAGDAPSIPSCTERVAPLSASMVLPPEEDQRACSLNACAYLPAWLSLQGSGVAAACKANVSVAVTWGTASLAPLNVSCNGTRVRMTFNLVEQPVLWLWAPAPLVVKVNETVLTSRIITTSAPAWMQPTPPRVACNATDLQPGQPLLLAGASIGAMLASASVSLTRRAYPQQRVPCMHVVAVGRDAITCTPALIPTAWAYVDTVVIAWPTATVITDLVNVLKMPQLTVPTAISAPASLRRAGSDTFSLQLPMSYWAAAAGTSAGCTTTCRVLVGRFQAFVPCPQESTTTAAAPFPAGAGIFHDALLELNGCMNVTLGQLSYDFAGVQAVAPTVMVLGPLQSNDSLQFRLQLVDATDSSGMQEVVVFGARCHAWQAANGSMVCSIRAADAGLLVGAPDEIGGTIAFSWGNSTFTSALATRIVVRPTVTVVSPIRVTPGSLLMFFGKNFCPGGSCANINMVAYIGPYPCTEVAVLSDAAFTCSAPSVTGTEPGFPTLNATAANSAGSSATLITGLVYPSAGFVLPTAPLPTAFYPSDTDSPWPLDADISVRLADIHRVPIDANMSCSLNVLTPGLLLLPIDRFSLLDVTGDGIVSFGRVGLRATFSNGAVVLSASCTKVGDDAAFVALLVTLRVLPLRTVLCDALPMEAASQASLAPITLALTLETGEALPGQACRGDELWAGPALPPVQCTLSAAANNSGAAAAVVQGSVGAVNSSSGLVTFADVTVSGTIGEWYQLRIRCAISSVPIPPTISALLRITECRPGTSPAGSICVQCVGGTYSDGGRNPCRSCPTLGAACDNGILTLLHGVYVAPSSAGRALDGSSSLFECALPSACVMNNTARSHACATGYTGPFCGICDSGGGYSRVGAECVPCLAAAPNAALLFAGVAAAVFFVGLAACNRGGTRQSGTSGRSDASIALRILLSYVQAVGSLKQFHAAGSEVYTGFMAWTDVLSTAVISRGPSQCLIGPSFVSVFFSTLAAPLLVCVAALLLQGLQACWKALRAARAWPGRVLGAGELCHRGASALGAAIVEQHREQRPTAILLFVAQLAYMPLVGACLAVFDCSPPVDGVRYLMEDLRQTCSGPTYAILSITAGITLLLFGVGFPVLVVARLARAAPSDLLGTPFAAAWSFIFAGYRVSGTDGAAKPEEATQASVRRSARCASLLTCSPRQMLWFEGVVLLRKACIVMLARLVQQPAAQTMAFMLLMVGFSSVHLLYRPFASAVFQASEGLAILSQIATAGLAALCTPAAGLSTDATLAVSWAMIAINVATVTLLAASAGNQHARVFCSRLRWSWWSSRRARLTGARPAAADITATDAAQGRPPALNGAALHSMNPLATVTCCEPVLTGNKPLRDVDELSGAPAQGGANHVNVLRLPESGKLDAAAHMAGRVPAARDARADAISFVPQSSRKHLL